ncbi:MAG: 50S ribosomal protein L22 [Acidobacteria bacterium]|nr:50S ribosomal protein L22 [Acidobacteriota bacterium]
MTESHATARYVRTSAQKAKLVLDQIRGRDVNQALAVLRFGRKSVARDIEKVLRSAIANAQHRDGFGGDVERLYVSACFANQGPSMKRIRPAPMGRAFRVVKRTAHLTVAVAERPLEITTVGEKAARKKPAAMAAVAEPTRESRKRSAKAEAAGRATKTAAPKKKRGRAKQRS